MSYHALWIPITDFRRSKIPHTQTRTTDHFKNENRTGHQTGRNDNGMSRMPIIRLIRSKFHRSQVKPLTASSPTANFAISLHNHFRVDLKKHHVEWDFAMDKLQFLGKYKVSGRVLILPITGAGDANITLCKYLIMIPRLCFNKK